MTEHLDKARNWIDIDLPSIYSTNISNKIYVTTLHNIIPRCLNKPILTTASKAYANNLSKRMTYAAVATTKTMTQPPCVKKIQQVDLTFDPTDFPSLPKQAPTTTSTPTSSSTMSSAAVPSPATMQPMFDYKAKLECLSIKIETKLCKHFGNIFSQLKSKINNFGQTTWQTSSS